MNEQIKLLYGNALDKAVPYTWHNLDHIEVEKIMKVFAELIVGECASVCENSNYEFGTIFTKMIKEHFGVE